MRCLYMLVCVLTYLPSTFTQASDMLSTSRILVAVVQMCYEAKDWDALNENIMLLTKRRSQLKQVRYLFAFDDCFLPQLSKYIDCKINVQIFHNHASCKLAPPWMAAHCSSSS